MRRSSTGGIRKRCGCARRQWAKCVHPWHFSFHHKATSKTTRTGKATFEHRISLHKYAGKPLGYWMSRSEAEALADQLRSEIRNGHGPDATKNPAVVAKTLGDVAQAYIRDYVHVPTRRRRAAQQFEYYLRIIERSEVPAAGGTTIALGSKPLAAITKADIKALCDRRLSDARAIRETQRVALEQGKRPKGRRMDKSGEVGINRLLARFRHLFNWAIAEGYVDNTPFKRGGVTVVRINRAAETARDRRLSGDEEQRLMRGAEPCAHMHALIIAALETGCRLGELLGLQWKHVEMQRGTILLVGSRTKTSQTRAVPITARLRAVLEMRQTGPDGSPLAAEAHVFGNEAGEPIGTIKTAWGAACRRAGIQELHFHDLRREFGSRLIETPGVHPALVRDWLGHANITTTSRYLATSAAALTSAAKSFETHRAQFAHGSHKLVNSDCPTDEACQPETIDVVDVEEVSRDGIEPSTRRLRGPRH
jgi:integrase